MIQEGDRIHIRFPWRTRLRWLLEAIWQHGWAEAWSDEASSTFTVTAITDHTTIDMDRDFGPPPLSAALHTWKLLRGLP